MRIGLGCTVTSGQREKCEQGTSEDWTNHKSVYNSRVGAVTTQDSPRSLEGCLGNSSEILSVPTGGDLLAAFRGRRKVEIDVVLVDQ